ncbi:MAG: hypothetical protein JWR38_806 [Mucilaginibacter sp.]|nr:hypothetical protein [Mucilaginibacter sp.]
MKKFIKLQLAIIIACALCIASCSKKDDTPKPPDTKTLLTAKTWSVVKLGNDDNKNGIIDDNELKPPSASVVFYFTFNNDGTLSVKQSDGKSTLTATYSWELTDAQTIKLNNQALNATVYWHIKTLTTDQFNVDQYEADNATLSSGVQCIPQ